MILCQFCFTQMFSKTAKAQKALEEAEKKKNDEIRKIRLKEREDLTMVSLQ